MRKITNAWIIGRGAHQKDGIHENATVIRFKDAR